METTNLQKCPHALIVPFPIQGHLNPMLKLSILLHHKGFHITFIHTEDNYKRLIKSQGHSAVKGLPDFQFVSMPDGRPPLEDGRGTTISKEDIKSICFSTNKNCLAYIRKLIEKLNHADSGGPPLTCLIADTAMCFALEAAEDIGVPGVLLQTASACADMCYLNVSQLLERGFIPVKDEKSLTNGYLETSIDWIEGMIPLCLKDFPSFILTTDRNDPLLNLLLTQISQSKKATATIINTFDKLEHNVLTAISQNFKPVFSIGPLHLLFDKLIPESNSLKCMSSSLWKQEPECLKWLDSKPDNSVIYINFGSTTVITPKQLNEFAWGLANSKKNFLLITRPGLVEGENSALQPEFLEEVGHSGHVVGWCPQEKVLSHPAVGGFLTHCGWNSMMESICSGVPMLCWPFFTDQHVNCRYACSEWGIGMEVNDNMKRDKVEILVKELLDGEKGKMMKRKAMELKEKVEEAVHSGGSSSTNLDKLINEVLNA